MATAAAGTAAATLGVGCSTAASSGDGGTGGDGGAPDEVVDNLIIGSGFGGSISAYRLADAGQRSVVLERGKWWRTAADPMSPDYPVFSSMAAGEVDKRSTWLANTQPLPGLFSGRLDRFTGVLERILGDGIDVVCPAGVGGGSLVYSGMMVMPPENLFDEVFPAGVRWQAMQPYYERVRAIMQPQRLPDDLLMRPEWTCSRTFIEHAMNAGYNVERLLCAFDFDRARMEVDGRLPPELIRGSYIFGLNNGAKGTLEKTYLGMALATNLTEVRELHWARLIERHPTGYRVTVDRIDTSGAVVGTTRIVARQLYVCAGTMNSTGLLLRSKAENGLPDLPEEVGSGLGNNGQHIKARRGVGVDTGAFQAGPACIMILDPANRIAMENGPAPLGTEMQVIIGTGQGIPSGRGTVTWNAQTGKIRPTWSASNDAEAATKAQEIIDRLNARNGGRDGTASLNLDVSITFHPLGGCVMGEATDLFGRLKRHPKLYVIDGSLIPGCTPCSNPFWTISANSERCIENIVANDYPQAGT